MRIIENLTNVIKYYNNLSNKEKRDVDKNRKAIIAKLTKVGATVCILSTLMTSCITHQTFLNGKEKIENLFDDKDNNPIVVTKVTDSEVGNNSTTDPMDDTPSTDKINDETPLYTEPSATTSVTSEVEGTDTLINIAPDTEDINPEQTLPSAETTTQTPTQSTTATSKTTTQATTSNKTSTNNNNSTNSNEASLEAYENFAKKLNSLLNSKLYDYYASSYSNLDKNYQPEVIEVKDISADENAIGFDFYGKTSTDSTNQYYKLRFNTNGTSLKKYLSREKLSSTTDYVSYYENLYNEIKNKLSTLSLANINLNSYKLIDCNINTALFNISEDYYQVLVYFKSSTATKINNMYNYTAYLEILDTNIQINTITISSSSRLSQSEFKTAVKNYIETGSTKMDGVSAKISNSNNVEFGANETLKVDTDTGLSL